MISGMPASGKDTISNLVCKKNENIEELKKHKSIEKNDKKKDTYYNISTSQFEEKIENNDFLQYHIRYGKYYGIDRKELLRLLKNNKIVIIHVGRIENYFDFINCIKKTESGISIENIIHILLWAPMEVLEERIIQRDVTTEEVLKRVDAVKQEFDDNYDMMINEKQPYDIVIKNIQLDNTIDLILKYTKEEFQEKKGYDEFYKYLKEENWRVE